MEAEDNRQRLRDLYRPRGISFTSPCFLNGLVAATLGNRGIWPQIPNINVIIESFITDYRKSGIIEDYCQGKKLDDGTIPGEHTFDYVVDPSALYNQGTVKYLTIQPL